MVVRFYLRFGISGKTKLDGVRDKATTEKLIKGVKQENNNGTKKIQTTKKILIKQDRRDRKEEKLDLGLNVGNRRQQVRMEEIGGIHLQRLLVQKDQKNEVEKGF